MVSETDYQKARKDAAYRQRFIDGIDTGEISHLVEGIKYTETEKKVTMSTHPSDRARIGISNTRSGILVYPHAFEVRKTLGDFLGTLVDHEGRHAAQFYAMPSLFLSNKDLCEYDAYFSQYEGMKNREVSQDYRAYVTLQCMHYGYRMSDSERVAVLRPQIAVDNAMISPSSLRQRRLVSRSLP